MATGERKASQCTVTLSPTSGDSALILNGGITKITPLRSIFDLYGQTAGVSKNVSGDFIVSGNTTITANLSVQGDSTLGNASTDITNVSGNLKHIGNYVHSGHFATTGNLTVQGNTTLGDSSTDLTTVNGSLRTVGHAYTTGTNYSNSGVITGGLVVQGNSTLGDAAADFTVVNGTLIVNGGQRTVGNLGVSGPSSLTGDLQVSSALLVGGTTRATGAVTFGSTLINSGDVFAKTNVYTTASAFVGGTGIFSGDLRVSGKSYFGDSSLDDASFVGDVIGRKRGVFEQGLAVNGTATFSGAISALSDITFAGDVTVGDALTVQGNTYIGDNSSDNHYIKGSVNLANNVTITGDINLTGKINQSHRTKWAKFKVYGSNRTATSMTYSLGYATFNIASASTYVEVGDSVFITGVVALHDSYKGNFTVTEVGASYFRYAVAGSPTTPDTDNAYLMAVLKPANTVGVSHIQGVGTNAIPEYKVVYSNAFTSTNVFPTICAKAISTDLITANVSDSDDDSASYKIIKIAVPAGGQNKETEVYFKAELLV
jgi:hypothetical protein